MGTQTVTNGDLHKPVLHDEVLAGLAVEKAGTYLDGTFGRGGHAGSILRQLGPEGRLFALDQDPEAIAYARARFADDSRFTITHLPFSQMCAAAQQWGVDAFDGIFLDIGVSSPQLDAPQRGFSFQQDGPLDMRMDPTRGASVAEWLAQAEVADITDVLRRYGEEKRAHAIARAIVAHRSEQPISRTRTLAEIVQQVLGPKRPGQKHPATRTFQALRIYINDELGELERALDAAVTLLKHGGRLAIISFHSLEDRMVKRFMRGNIQAQRHVRRMPVVEQTLPPLKTIGKPIRASGAECDENPRARSAVLRIAERRVH